MMAGVVVVLDFIIEIVRLEAGSHPMFRQQISCAKRHFNALQSG
jgi:hypothetical protein